MLKSPEKAPDEVSRATNAPDDFVKLGKDLVFLLDRILPLRLSVLELVLQLLNVTFLVCLAAVQSREARYQNFNLLLFYNQVARQLG